MTTTAQTLTIADFLLARITEDEAEIGALVGRDEKAGPNGIGWAEVGAISDVLMCGHARALAECEAKRRIVSDWADGDGPAILAVWMNNPDLEAPPHVHYALIALRALAAVYSDHPDYREEWKP